MKLEKCILKRIKTSHCEQYPMDDTNIFSVSHDVLMCKIVCSHKKYSRFSF